MSRTTGRSSIRTKSKSGIKAAAKGLKAVNSRMPVAASETLEEPGDRGLTAFGERLVSILQSKGMNDSELAKALGIAQPNIHTLKYKTDRPRHKTVLKIAKVLGVTPEALLPQATILGAQTSAEGTKVYLVIESKQGRQTIRLA